MIRISIRRVTIALAVLSALFSVMGLVTQILAPGPANELTWSHVFDLDAEATLPAWFSTAMLLVSALLLWMIGTSRDAGDRFAGHWKFLAAVFLYISADENASLHETFGYWISRQFGDLEFMNVYAWLIPGVAFLIYMAVVSWKFLGHLPSATRRGMVTAAVLYVTGAGVIEGIEARLTLLEGTLQFSKLTVVEETLEMVGLVIFIHVLLSYLRALPKSPVLTVEP